VLRWRLDYVFSIYAVFAVAIVVRSLLRAVAILRGASPDDDGKPLLAAPDANGDPRP
jgi:hypothetical protein